MARVTAFAFIFLISLTLKAQKILSLNESIAIAIKNNIDVAQSTLQVETASINHNQSKTNLLPTVNGEIAHGMNRGRSIDPFTNSYVNQKINYANYSLGSDIVLFNGLTLQNAIKQNMFLFDAAKMDLQQKKDNLTLAVILAYLQVLCNDDQVALAMKQVAVTQVQLDRLEKLNKDGAIDPPQVFDLKGQLKEAELNLVTAQNSIASSKLSLTQLMNIAFDPNIELEKVSGEELLQPFPFTVDEVYNNATNEMALVKAAEFRVKSAEAAIKISKGLLFPTLALRGNLNSNFSSAASQEVFTNITEEPTSGYVMFNGSKQPVYVSQKNFKTESINYSDQLKNNVFSNVGISLRLPIFNSLASRNRVKLATIQSKNAGLEFQNVKIALRQEIEQAYLNMNNSWSRYKILLEQVAAYAESFRAAEVRFNAGVGTTVDYMVAKDNVDRAHINLVSTQYDYLLRKKILEFYYIK